MAVGKTPITCYEGEDVIWEWTFTDATGTVTSLASHLIQVVVKASATAPNPPLIGPVVCTITSATAPMKFRAQFNVNLDAGTYNVSARRENVGNVWQYVDSTLTVKDSGSR